MHDLRELRWRAARIIVVVSDDDQEAVFQALRFAPAGILTDRDEPTKLLEAIERTDKSKPYYTPRVQRIICGKLLPGTFEPRLNPREYQVFRLLGSGKTVSEIANILGLHRRTVNAFTAKIRKKCGVSTLKELLRVAIKSDNAVNG